VRAALQNQILEEPLQSIFSKSVQATIIFAGNNIIDCNDAALRLFGASNKDELLNTPPYKLIYTTKSSQALFQNIISTTTHRESWKTEMLCYSLERKIIHTNTSFTSFQTHNGESLIYSVWVEFGDSRSVYNGTENIPAYDFQVKGGHSSLERPVFRYQQLLGSDNNITSRTGQGHNQKPQLTANRYGLVEFDVRQNTLRIERSICEFIGLQKIVTRYFITTPEAFTLQYVKPDQKSDALLKWANLKQLKPTSLQRNRLEFILINDFGLERRVQILLKNVLSDSGEVLKYHGVVHDFTEQVSFENELNRYKSNLELLVNKTNQKLNQSQSDLTDVLDFANLSTWELDLRSNTYNVTGSILHGKRSSVHKNLQPFRSKTFTQSDIRNFLDASDWQLFEERMHQLMTVAIDGHIEYLELRANNSKNRQHHYYVSAKCLVTGNQERKIYGTIQDITHIKNTEEENKRLIELVGASADIIIIVNKELSIEYINKAGKIFFGIPLSTVPETINNSKCISISNIAGAGIQTAIREGHWSGETFVAGPGSHVVPFSVQIKAHPSDKEVEFVSIVFRDIGKQKRVEQDLITKNRELDTFLYRTAHDFRAPITTLLGLVQLASIEVKDPLAHQYFKLFEEQFGQLQKLNVNISKLISINETSVFDGSPERMDFKFIINDVLKELQGRFDLSAIEIETHIDPRIEYWSKAEEMIRIILFNTIENAILYKVSHRKSCIGIRIENRQSTNTLTLSVSDNGAGIPQEIFPKIFDMFYRGNINSRGFGLGLFKTKKIVEKLCGTIEVESEPDKGSSFKIKLPLYIK
jgi:signal transduction histidine kinase